MSGKKYLLDTNTALYVLGGKILSSSLPEGEYAIIAATAIETDSVLITRDKKLLKISSLNAIVL